MRTEESRTGRAKSAKTVGHGIGMEENGRKEGSRRRRGIELPYPINLECPARK